MPLLLPSDAKLLWHDMHSAMGLSALGGWIYFSKAKPPVLPDGITADTYETTYDAAGAIVPLAKMVAEFCSRGVSIALPRRGWICGWWTNGIHYTVYRVATDQGFYVLVNVQKSLATEWPTEAGPEPLMPLQLPNDCELLADLKDYGWGGLSRVWIYRCPSRLPLSPKGTGKALVEEELVANALNTALQKFGDNDIWIRGPRRAWESNWRNERQPDKWEYYSALLVEADRCFYVMVNWGFDPSVRLEMPHDSRTSP